MSHDQFGIRMVLALLVWSVSICAGAQELREAALIQLIGRAERSAGVWRATCPGVAWRTEFSGTRAGVTTRDPSGYGVTIDGIRMTPIPPSQARRTAWYRNIAAGHHLIEVTRMRGTPHTPGLFFDLEGHRSNWRRHSQKAIEACSWNCANAWAQGV
jgi:hypothetical protein